MMRRILILLTLFASHGVVSAELRITDRSNFNLSPFFKYYIDKDDKVKNDNPSEMFARIHSLASKGSFEHHYPDFGVLRTKLWAIYQGSIPKTKGRQFFLFDSERIENLDLYFIFRDSTIRHYHYDTSIPFNKRVIPYRKLVFPLENPGNISEIIYSIKGDQLIKTRVKIIDETMLLESQSNQFLLNGAFYGILFALFLYNAVLFLFVRDRSYLYYIFFIFSHIMVQASVDGHLHQYFFPDSYIAARDIRVIAISMALDFSILFGINFMEIRTFSPRLYRLLMIVLISSFIPFFVYFQQGFFDAIFYSLISSTSGIVLSFLAAVLLIKKSKMARYFLFAWTPLLFSLFLQSLRPANYELVAAIDGNFMMKVTHIFEALTLSAALGQRFKMMRHTIVERENELFKARMANLKNKLRPHFVLNTLGIILLFIQKEQNRAEQVLTWLVHTYHYLLKFSDRDLVLLSDEISFTESYANILTQKHGSTLSINFKIKGPVQRVLIPPLTLQPVVENAYKHGVRTVKTGKIDVKILVDREILLITVINNANNRPLKKDLFSNTTIGSIKKRLEMTFTESAMDIEKKGNKTKAIIRYAYNKKKM